MNKYQKQGGTEGKNLELFKRKKSEMPDVERVSNLQRKLYQRAKQEPDRKFYVLYDKVFLGYILREAWKRVRVNKGSAGVDGIHIRDVETYGVKLYLDELAEDLRKQTYRPSAVRRKMIDKANGKKRPLGIPTVRDRIAQTACLMIIEPIFEADFDDSSHGFRPNRGAKGAIKEIKNNLQSGKASVYDADLSKYFDTIPHNKLMIALKERISDPRMLKLIMKWLKAPVDEDGKMTGGKSNKLGTPQGGVISPLLANIYMNLLDRIVNNGQSIFGKFGISMIRYADDFVLMGYEINQKAKDELFRLLSRMDLILNIEKTHQIDARRESFKFLGFTFRYDKDIYGRNRRYYNIIPNPQSEKKLRNKISDFLKKNGHSNVNIIVNGLNSIIRGWLNYYEIAGVTYTSECKRRLRYYLNEKLFRYYKRKSQRRCKLYGQDAFETLVNKYGLINPTKYKVC